MEAYKGAAKSRTARSKEEKDNCNLPTKCLDGWNDYQYIDVNKL